VGKINGLARKACLQIPYEEQIMTSRQLYKWAPVKISSVTSEYCTVEDHSKEMTRLEERLRKAPILPRTQKICRIIPAPKNQVQTKVLSDANAFNITHTVHLQDEENQVEDIRGFVTCQYEKNWWLACFTCE
jgi:hypothetical protein